MLHSTIVRRNSTLGHENYRRSGRIHSGRSYRLTLGGWSTLEKWSAHWDRRDSLIRERTECDFNDKLPTSPTRLTDGFRPTVKISKAYSMRRARKLISEKFDAGTKWNDGQIVGSSLDRLNVIENPTKLVPSVHPRRVVLNKLGTKTSVP